MRIVTIPNLLTLLRLGLVPVVAYCLVTHHYEAAFACFVLAGATDALDGMWARHFHVQSQFGAWLDPAADKAMIVMVFTLLAALAVVPVWLLVLVAARDLAIIAGFAELHIRGRVTELRPLGISKANTLVQFAYLALVLAELSFHQTPAILVDAMMGPTVALTALSFLAYLKLWLRSMRAAS